MSNDYDFTTASHQESQQLTNAIEYNTYNHEKNTQEQLQKQQSSSIIQSLKNSLKQFLHQQQRQSQQEIHIKDQNESEKQQTIMSLTLQLNAQKHQLNQLRTSALENENIKNRKIQQQKKQQHRKQITQYCDLIAEQDRKIHSLQHTIDNLNAKIHNYQSQVEKAANIKFNYEQTIYKELQCFKQQLRQLNTNLQDSQLDKIVLEDKINKIVTRSKGLASQIQANQEKNKLLQNKCEMLRIRNIELKQENMELKFTIQHLKINGQRQSHKNYNQISKNHRKGNNSYQLNSDDSLIQRLKQLSNHTNNIIDLYNKTVNNGEEEQLKKIDELASLSHSLQQQNKNLYDQLYEKNKEIDELKIMINGEYYDQILKQRKPSIFEILMEKKNNISQYENIVKRIEEYIMVTNIQSENSAKQDKGVTCDITKVDAKESMQRVNPSEQFLRIQQENKNLLSIMQSDKIKLRDLFIKLQQQEFSSMRAEKLCTLYRSQLKQMVKNYESNKMANKRGTKIKKKKRCQNCLFQLNLKKSIICKECKQQLHHECIEKHECVEQYDDTHSVCSNQLRQF